MEMIRRAAKEAMTEATRRALDDMDRNQGRGRERVMKSPSDRFFSPEGNRKARRKAVAISRHKEPA